MSRANGEVGGFTLIELVVVIVILGILAAVAVPKFVDLKTDATNASAADQAGKDRDYADQQIAQCIAKGTDTPAGCKSSNSAGTP